MYCFSEGPGSRNANLGGGADALTASLFTFGWTLRMLRQNALNVQEEKQVGGDTDRQHRDSDCGEDLDLAAEEF